MFGSSSGKPFKKHGMDFTSQLIRWYNQNKRDLPWRKTGDPYLVWVSEIILQQTQVEQGLEYYNRFIARYKDIVDLSKASEDDVLKVWQGLGYYTRARNMLATAREIVEKYEGRFPETYQELINLKGIGEYTAGAILSFCFNKAYAVVDGNVMRVLARYMGVDTPVNTSKGKKEIGEIAVQMIPADSPGLFNQAVMEFGARQCISRHPLCPQCVVHDRCRAYIENRVHSLPVRKSKAPLKKRYFNYLVFRVTGDEPHILLRKRTSDDIWKNLYDFPLIEAKRLMGARKRPDDAILNTFLETKGIQVTLAAASPVYKHVLSHRHIQARFFILLVDKMPRLKAGDLQFIAAGMLGGYPVPKLIETFMAEYCTFFI
jgi:A/G-specific adenine glycosylase